MGKKRGNKKYCMIFLSYLMIMAIPLITGGMLHLYNRRLANEQSEAMGEKMLFGIQQEVDNRMNHIWQLTSMVTRNANLNHVLNSKLNSGTDMQYQYYLLGVELEKILVTEEKIKDIFVYFGDEGKIVSTQGTMDLEMYKRLFLDSSYSHQQLEEYLKPYRYKEVLTFPGAKNEDLLFCVMSDPSGFTGDPGYSVAAVVEMSEMERVLDSIRWEKASTVFIQDENQQIVCKMGEADVAGQLVHAENKDNSYYKAKLSGVPFSVMMKKSQVMDWSYYMLMPQAQIEKNARLMQRYYMIALFACVFVGFGVAGVLASKNYHPVRILAELMAQYKKQNGVEPIEQGADEYQWLQQQTEQFFKERVDRIKMLKDNRKELKNYYLLKLLENTYTDDLEENLVKNQIIFTYDHFIAIQFMAKTNGGEKLQEQEQVLFQFILKNIFTEMAEEFYVVYMVLIGDRMLAIVNFPEPVQDNMNRIRQLIQQLQELIEAKFSYEIIALSGGCCDSRSEISKSYADTCEIESYVSLLDENLIFYDDVKDLERKYWYNAELDQKLFNAVKAGNQKIAEELLGQVLRQHGSGKLALGVYRCLIFDILGTILKAADAAGYHNVIEEYDITEKLSVCMPVDRTEQLFRQLIDGICAKIHEAQKDSSQDKGLSKKVQQYIQENFRDADLNVSLTGQHFHMTPSYLSSIYKKQTGDSLLEYLNQVRLDEAERLLAQGMSVAEVAEKAGFRDSTYLIRVFKKKRGVTPGQIKQNL